jgi:hypothetical protein
MKSRNGMGVKHTMFFRTTEKLKKGTEVARKNDLKVDFWAWPWIKHKWVEPNYVIVELQAGNTL